MDDIPEAKPHKKQNKNALKGVDLNIVSYQYFDGVDLLTIPGVSHSTVLALMSETRRQEVPHSQILCCLAQTCSELKIALRNSANAVGNLKDSDLAKFFCRIAFMKGRQTAINATARKKAVIIWNMVTRKEQYQARENYLFVHQKRHLLKKIKQQLKDMGFTSSNTDKNTREMLSDN